MRPSCSQHACEQCPTRRVCLASGLEPACLQALAEFVAPSQPLRRGDELYRAGETAEHCYVVRSGVFKTSVVSRDGQEHVTGFHYPGEIMGLSGRAEGIYRDSAVALETSTACRVPVADLQGLLELPDGPRVVSSLVRLFGQAEQRRLDERTNLSRKGADQRVAGFLLGLGGRLRALGRDARQLPVPMSRTDLANYLGMTLECLSRVVTRFSQAGLVQADRTCITVRDADALRAMAGHLDG